MTDYDKTKRLFKSYDLEYLECEYRGRRILRLIQGLNRVDGGYGLAIDMRFDNSGAFESAGVHDTALDYLPADA